MRLSPKERQLLALLPRDGSRKNTNQLVEEFYRGEDVPFYARTIIAGRMRTIMQKLRTHDDPDIIIRSTERMGPTPIEYWVEKATPWNREKAR